MFEDSSRDVFCFVSILSARRDQRKTISFILVKLDLLPRKKLIIIIKTGVISDTRNKPNENR